MPRPAEWGRDTKPVKSHAKPKDREALLSQAEREIHQGIFASKTQSELDRLHAREEFCVERMDCLQVARAHAVASRKVRLVRNLIEVMPVPARLLDRIFPEVEPFADLVEKLVELGESYLVDLIHRDYSEPQHLLEWTEREIAQTGKLCTRPTASGFQEPQSYPQWRTCMMVPTWVDVPLEQVCIFQDEAFVFLEKGHRTYQIRDNMLGRYGWHMAPRENRVGIYMLGRLAGRAELAEAMLNEATFDLQEAIGADDGRPRFTVPDGA